MYVCDAPESAYIKGKRSNSHKFLLFSLRFICTSATHTRTLSHASTTRYTLYGISKTIQKWFLLFSLCRKEIEGITLNKLSPYTIRDDTSMSFCVGAIAYARRTVSLFRLYVCVCTAFSSVYTIPFRVALFLCLSFLFRKDDE